MLKIKLLYPHSKAPTLNGIASCFDVYAAERIRIPQMVPTQVRLGFATEFESFYGCKLRGKSGLATGGVFPIGGVIDSDYRGEWMAIMLSVCDSHTFDVGDKVAQFSFEVVNRPLIAIVDELSDTNRGDKGFGSSGR